LQSPRLAWPNTRVTRYLRAYVADWDELPQWQQETDADIFERIEQESQAPRDHQQPHP